jgi:hypothetical protein
VSSLKWSIVALSCFEAGWMLFDGTRALIVGDYVTPSTGEHAGRLGPWTGIVAAVGIEPRSTLMKLVFVVYGAAWLAAVACFALDHRWAREAMLVAAVGSLWYLWVGTVTSAIVIVLLLVGMALGRSG